MEYGDRPRQRVRPGRIVHRSARYLRKSLLGVRIDGYRAPTDLARAATTIVLLSQFFYLLIAFQMTKSSLRFSTAYEGGPPTAPLWPLKLVQQSIGVDWLAHTTAVTAVGLLFAISAAIAPRILVWRLGAFLYLLLHVGLSNSYGSINHGTHALLFVSFALLFLPRRKKNQPPTRRDVLACLNVFWLTQVVLLLPYTLSGLWKVWNGGLGLLSPDALTRILLNRLLAEADDIPPLMPLVSQHDLLTYAMWLLTIYIEIFAILVVFRPHLHRPFGIVLMLFHIISDWLMNIAFPNHIILVGMFLVLSPLAPVRLSFSALAQSLPIIGIPFRARARLRSADERRPADQVWLVYDGECPLCSNYAQFLQLRQSVKELTLIDARQGGPVVEEIRNLPHDLDQGMVAVVDGSYYVGHEALNVLALLAENRGVFNRFNRLAFSSPVAARLGYPWLKLGRWILLRLKDVAPINDSRPPHGTG